MLVSAGKTKVGLLIIVLAIVVVVLGLVWLVVGLDNQPEATTSVATDPGNPATPTPMASQATAAPVQRTTLTDPSGQNVLGELVKTSPNADEHRFMVTVKLPDPGDANFYAVWLTQAEGTEQKYLGKLSKSGTDYVLEYQSSEAEQNFDKIVVTSGAQADSQVENIVAEGTIASQLLL